MLASVNHPGICSIYGIDDADGMRVLVLELVDGLTLAETLSLRASSGEAGLPVRDAIGIGRQIAEALEREVGSKTGTWGATRSPRQIPLASAAAERRL